jgi:hypothetical protein
VFKKLGNPVFNNSDAVTFAATLVSGTADDTGVWSNEGGALHLAAREGAQAPGCAAGVVFSQFKQVALPDMGGVVLLAKLRGAGVDSANDMGIWAGSGTGQQLVLREGDVHPVTSGTVGTITFLPAVTGVTGQTRCFNGAGELLYGVKFTSGTTGSAICKAVPEDGSYVHEVVAAQNDAATGIAGAKYAKFGNPALNEAGHVAFGAKISGTSKAVGVTGSNNLGIWADDATGTRQLVVRCGAFAPDESGAVTATVFKKFSDPVYSGSNAVAFLGTLTQLVGGVDMTNDTGVWSNDGGTLHLVAREGGQAPGCASGVVFSQLKQIALPDQGGVLLYARLAGTGVTSANDYGIWAVDTGGTLQLIAREGDPHAVTGKTINKLTFLPVVSGVSGQTRSFSQATGDLVYSATFTDKSAGIFKVVFP